MEPLGASRVFRAPIARNTRFEEQRKANIEPEHDLLEPPTFALADRCEYARGALGSDRSPRRVYVDGEVRRAEPIAGWADGTSDRKRGTVVRPEVAAIRRGESIE